MAEKKINGVTYRYDRLPADQGFPLLLRVLKMLGSAKGAAAVLTDANLSLASIAAAAANPAIVGSALEFLGDMDTTEVYALVEEMVSNCRADGEPAVIGVKPSDTAEMLQVAFFAFQTEFGGFFGDGTGSGGKKPAPAPLRSPRPR
ncbi:phage tail assembly chaperone [Aquabacter sp. CN5-332]|uniref:phage tail assembly chaperone n=1 Tax=Aquabacter sp. CN5-332 TaxID=3156608 RepID=UPI0032B5CD2B